MKPILFNTDMVRGLLANRKTVTRRVVKKRYSDSVFEMFKGQLCEASPFKPPVDNGDGTTTRFVRNYVPCRPSYRPGDILYVREKWRIVDYLDGLSLKFEYEADGKISDFIDFTNDRLQKFLKYISRKKWCPSIFMPREAARIFLRVTDVRVERLQNISPLEILEEEGIEVEFPQPKPPYMSLAYTENRLKPAVKKAFSDLWDSTIKPTARALYGWVASPWVWVIEFERISREEANP